VPGIENNHARLFLCLFGVIRLGQPRPFVFDLCFSGISQHPKQPFWGRLGVGDPQMPGAEVSLISTDDTFRKFYYNPQREHLRAVLGEKRPDVLKGGKPVALPEHKGCRVKELAAQYQALSADERVRLSKMIGGVK